MSPRACRRRNVDQRRSPLGRPRGRRGRYFLTVRGETRIPSFRSSSLAMRSSPHNGFSLAIRRIRAWVGAGIGGRPGRDFRRQNSFHPIRRQRISVSGRTSAERHSNRRDNSIRLARVAGSTRRGFTRRSTYSASCRRKNRTSAARDPRRRNRSPIQLTRSDNTPKTMAAALRTAHHAIITALIPSVPRIGFLRTTPSLPRFVRREFEQRA